MGCASRLAEILSLQPGICVVFGPPGSHKTRLLLTILANSDPRKFYRCYIATGKHAQLFSKRVDGISVFRPCSIVEDLDSVLRAWCEAAASGLRPLVVVDEYHVNFIAAQAFLGERAVLRFLIAYLSTIKYQTLRSSASYVLVASASATPPFWRLISRYADRVFKFAQREDHIEVIQKDSALKDISRLKVVLHNA